MHFEIQPICITNYSRFLCTLKIFKLRCYTQMAETESFIFLSFDYRITRLFKK